MDQGSAAPRMSPRARITLTSRAGAPERAGAFARAALQAWGEAELADEAGKLASELVDVAARGAGARLEIRCAIDSAAVPPEFLFEVVDRSAAVDRGAASVGSDRSQIARIPLTKRQNSSRVRIGAVVVDRSGLVVDVGEEAAELLGHGRADLLGRRLAELWCGALRAEPTGVGRWQGERTVRRADGGTAELFAVRSQRNRLQPKGLECADGRTPGYAPEWETVWLLVDRQNQDLLLADGAAPAPPVPSTGPDRTADRGPLRDRLGGCPDERTLLDRAAGLLQELGGAAAVHLLLPCAGDGPADLLEIGASTDPLAVVGLRTTPAALAPAGVPPARLGGVPLEAAGQSLGLVVAAGPAGAPLGPAALARLRSAADTVAAELWRLRSALAERQRQGGVALLAEAGELLGGVLDEEQVAALAAQLVVPRIADWAAVYLADPDDPARRQPSRLAVVWHSDERRVGPLRALLEASGVDAPVPGFVRSVPLEQQGVGLGTLVVGRSTPLSPGLARLTEELARRIALALAVARALRRQTHTSHVLQSSLVPQQLSPVPGIETALVYEPAMSGDDVGGDFYDVFPLSGGRWGFVLGDVCGHGPEAAAVTGLARYALRMLTREFPGLHPVPDPAAVLGRLNQVIVDEGDRGRLLSLVYGELAPRAEGGVRCSAVCAGGPPPLRLRPDGKVEEVAGPQLMLGVLSGHPYVTETFLLDPGDLLLCVTDGVTERRDGATQLDDQDGLAALLAECTGLTAAGTAQRLRRAVHAFSREPSRDDLAILALRVRQ
ncbi:SpoIIE family protein phosphatase [Streptacidiphilus sp. N1-10]|uniref:SpoIIE family protein phosphatase n=1 Tax=Streptacidiphilus jeojiensis TaxID=3229225 RepID=A0ABV6XUH8_9ACTN